MHSSSHMSHTRTQTHTSKMTNANDWKATEHMNACFCCRSRCCLVAQSIAYRCKLEEMKIDLILRHKFCFSVVSFGSFFLCFRSRTLMMKLCSHIVTDLHHHTLIHEPQLHLCGICVLIPIRFEAHAEREFFK